MSNRLPDARFPQVGTQGFGAKCLLNGDTEKIVRLASGMVRSDSEGKPDYTLVDLAMLERWAQHMTAHAASKGHNNWRNASTDEDVQRFQASAFRHFVQWLRGDTDEDHAAALFFNVAGAEYVKAQP